MIGKRFIAGWFVIIVIFGNIYIPLSAKEWDVPEELENLYARSAVLMDADSGRVLFGKEANTVLPMASTTKIMTCILALEYMQENEVADVSAYAASQPKVHLGVQEGEKYYLKDLLYSLMLESHNDSAVVIAEHIGGSVEAFAAMMNAKAEELGCVDTYFVTPNGLDGVDENGIHATTARDLARIMKYCICDSAEKEHFLKITRTRNYVFSECTNGRSFSCTNHNAFLDMMEGALSGKTGFTGNAGYCYVGALESDGRTFIVALLACGWPNNKNYKWSDTKKLMRYGMENYHYKTIPVSVGEEMVPVKNGIHQNKSLGEEVTARIAAEQKEWKLLLGEQEHIEKQIVIKNSLQAPVLLGDTIGTVSYWIGEEKIREIPIRTKESIEERTYEWCLRQILSRFYFVK